MRLVNLTAHPIRVVDAKGAEVASYPPSGREARLREAIVHGDGITVDGVAVPTVVVRYGGEVDGLPSPRFGVAYIVSRVLAGVVDRPDLYFPADEVRNAGGYVIGCRSLGRFDGRRLHA